jgi:hypothetical protein
MTEINKFLKITWEIVEAKQNNNTDSNHNKSNTLTTGVDHKTCL